MLRERRDRIETGAAPHPERTAPQPPTLSPAGVLAPGVTPEATTAATAPIILAAFTAQTDLQSEYGEML